MAFGQRTDKHCEDCGVLMTNVNIARKFCSACAKKRQREYQRRYIKRFANSEKPQEHIANPNKKYCKGCAYWGGYYENNYCCNYIFVEGHSRPCPPGKGCTEKIVGERKQAKDFEERRWI